MPKNLYEINLILIKCLIRGENTMHPPLWQESEVI